MATSGFRNPGREAQNLAILKYRPLNATEKKSGNEWTKSQVELSLEEQLKLLKKQFQELYLL